MINSLSLFYHIIEIAFYSKTYILHMTGENVIRLLEEKENQARILEEEKEKRKFDRIKKREEKERVTEEKRLMTEEKKKERERKRLEKENEKRQKQATKGQRKRENERGENTQVFHGAQQQTVYVCHVKEPMQLTARCGTGAAFVSSTSTKRAP